MKRWTGLAVIFFIAVLSSFFIGYKQQSKLTFTTQNITENYTNTTSFTTYLDSAFVVTEAVIVNLTPCTVIKPSVTLSNNIIEYSFDISIPKEEANKSECIQTSSAQKIILKYGPLPNGKYFAKFNGFEGLNLRITILLSENENLVINETLIDRNGNPKAAGVSIQGRPPNLVDINNSGSLSFDLFGDINITIDEKEVKCDWTVKKRFLLPGEMNTCVYIDNACEVGHTVFARLSNGEDDNKICIP